MKIQAHQFDELADHYGDTEVDVKKTFPAIDIDTVGRVTPMIITDGTTELAVFAQVEGSGEITDIDLVYPMGKPVYGIFEDKNTSPDLLSGDCAVFGSTGDVADSGLGDQHGIAELMLAVNGLDVVAFTQNFEEVTENTYMMAVDLGDCNITYKGADQIRAFLNNLGAVEDAALTALMSRN